MISDCRNIDCMEAMREFPDKFFELAIVDPPYAVGASNGTFEAQEKRFKEQTMQQSLFKHDAA